MYFSSVVPVTQVTCWRKGEGDGCSGDKVGCKEWQRPEQYVHKVMMFCKVGT